MKAINTGNTFQLYDNSVRTYDELPAGTYTVCFSEMKGFYLSMIGNFEVTEKIYGVHTNKVEKVFKAYEQAERNLGVILSGDKGIGKSLFAKMISLKAIECGLPLIVVEGYIPGIASFLNSIEQRCVVLFDEFDKTFGTVHDRQGTNADPQTEMLTLFDGINISEKLFVITCNDISKLSSFLVNRPGRFHYHFRFGYPTGDEVTEYLQDNVDEQYWGEITDVVRFASRVKLTYDCLRAIAFELNNGESFKNAINDLNIMNIEVQKYRIEVFFSDGSTYIFHNWAADLFSDMDISLNPYVHNDGDLEMHIEFNPCDIQYETNSYKPYIAEENIKWHWDFDPDDYREEKENPNGKTPMHDAEASNLHPVKIVFTRLFNDKKYNYKSI